MPESSPPIIVFPLYPQPKLKGLKPEELAAERKRQRAIIRKESTNPGVRAMFNMVERVAARLQKSGIEPDATPHQAGQAYGAGYVYELLRTVLEGTEEEDEESAEP